jgi:hypothetical protein
MSLLTHLKNNFLILLLVLTSAILRLYGLFNLDYTYDELSVFTRLGYVSFSELIEKGVLPDGHPALVQVFLYYYTAIFGSKEWVVKLPFILCSIASVYLIYDIGKRWVNETSGILSASLLTCSQFFVAYGTIARPYASGLFLSLLVLKFWMEIVLSESPKTKHYVYFSIFSALAALNHHFSMMFSALCGLFGLFFISRANMKKYILACFGAIVLYAPHIPILLGQLKVGGIGAASGGWLAPPQYDFIFNFIFYLFHYSYLFVLVFIGIIAFSYFKNVAPKSKQENKLRLIWLILFTLNFVIGFFYSLLVNPVIQFSTMIFATPCFILFLASFAKEFYLRQRLLTMGLLLAIGISTLIFKRKHFEFIFDQAYDTYVQTTDEIIKEKGSSSIFSMCKGDPWYLNFYNKKYNALTDYKIIDSVASNSAYFKSIFDTLKTNYVALGDFEATQLLYASHYYPFIYKKRYGYVYELYVLSKDSTKEGALRNELRKMYSTNFDKVSKGFSWNENAVVKVGGQSHYKIDSTNEYPLAFKIENHALNCNEGQYVIAEIKYKSDRPIKGLLAAGIEKDKVNKYFNASEILETFDKKNKIQTVYLSIFVSADFNDKNNELTVFFWNNEKQNLLVTEFSIYSWDINPYRYAMLYDVKD